MYEIHLHGGPKDGVTESVTDPWPRTQLVVDDGMGGTATYYVREEEPEQADWEENPTYDGIPSSAPYGAVGPEGPQGPLGPVGPEGPPGPVGRGITYRGVYNKEVAYAINDAVTEGDAFFISKLEANTGHDPQLDEEGLYWERSLSGTNPRGTYSSEATYRLMDLVVSHRNAYVCVAKTVTGTEPRADVLAKGGNWVLFAEGGASILSGAGAPPAEEGAIGDFYVKKTEPRMIYGPKTEAGWGEGTSLEGKEGKAGPAGPPGGVGPAGPAGPAGPSGSAASVEVGDGVKTEFLVEHKLGSRHVVTNVYEKAAPYSEVEVDIAITDENHVTVTFGSAPAENQYVVVVISGAGGSGGGGGGGAAPLLYEPFTANRLKEFVFDTGTIEEGMVVEGGVLKFTDNKDHSFHSETLKVVDSAQIVKVNIQGKEPVVYLGLKYTSPSDILFAQVNNNTLGLYNYLGGVLEAHTTGISMTPGHTYWLVGRVSGNVVHAEWWEQDPHLGHGEPLAQVTFTLSGERAEKFGAGKEGKIGLRLGGYESGFVAGETTLDDWTVVVPDPKLGIF